MSFMSMEPTNQTFQEMMSNGIKYKIPRFQRDYAWDQEQWEDLWADIESIIKSNIIEQHYMGYIVLQRQTTHDYIVIDGQQRLVTLSLVILAAMKRIDELAKLQESKNDLQESQNNKDRLDELRRRFVGTKNPISLQVDNRLSLNRNNDTNFRKICSKLELANTRGLTATNKLLNKAFTFFCQKKMGETGQIIAEFIEKVTSGMIFTKIVVQNDLNAYKVFETLNARGVKLSTPDLLKNYLFSTITKNNDVPDNELDDLDKRWGDIVTQLGETNFTDFIRYHHNFQAKLSTKKDLFSAVRKLADTPQSAYKYLDSLDKYASLYASLNNPNDDWWTNQENLVYRETTNYIKILSLFNIKQVFTILMIAYFKFTPNEFITVCRYMTMLSIRYNVICHFSPNEQEYKYNQIAMKIYNGQLNRASHVKNDELFRDLYPDDKTFRNSFEYLKIPSRQTAKKICYLLAEIERHLGQPIEEQNISLEHICPYNPTNEWIKTFGEGYEEVQDRLGNMVLLTPQINKSVGTKSFTEKKEIYAASEFKLAKKVATYQEWNKESVDTFQTWLAEQAIKIWRVDYE